MQIKQSQFLGPESKALTEFVEHSLPSSLKRLGSRLRSTVVSLHTTRAAEGPLIVIRERDSSMRPAVGRAFARLKEAVWCRAGFRLRLAGRKAQEPDSKSREIINE